MYEPASGYNLHLSGTAMVITLVLVSESTGRSLSSKLMRGKPLGARTMGWNDASNFRVGDVYPLDGVARG